MDAVVTVVTGPPKGTVHQPDSRHLSVTATGIVVLNRAGRAGIFAARGRASRQGAPAVRGAGAPGPGKGRDE
ncbi:hypothetical protein F6W96_19980 [Nocardia terpenica]|uniref:Uncharacterized protein n=1 Tax=Nocardia terpenica TaxID=455432 RepID=A0A6G9Z470_9NOCA|nr:hypothetical protein F6W96_19980 [Nocardia terpenica]